MPALRRCAAPRSGVVPTLWRRGPDASRGDAELARSDRGDRGSDRALARRAGCRAGRPRRQFESHQNPSHPDRNHNCRRRGARAGEHGCDQNEDDSGNEHCGHADQDGNRGSDRPAPRGSDDHFNKPDPSPSASTPQKIQCALRPPRKVAGHRRDPALGQVGTGRRHGQGEPGRPGQPVAADRVRGDDRPPHGEFP
jgi:hypothetical protein